MAVVVVLPEPCRPTIMIGTGAGALRSIGSAAAQSPSAQGFFSNGPKFAPYFGPSGVFGGGPYYGYGYGYGYTKEDEKPTLLGKVKKLFKKKRR